MLQIIDESRPLYALFSQIALGLNPLRSQGIAILLCSLCWVSWAIPVFANTPEEWVKLGTQVHGGFGSYIALGIRIGLDARERLQAGPRELDVTYYSAVTAPCPCVVDGVMLATVATPGQNLLRVATTPSPPDTFGVVEIQHRATGAMVRYTIPNTAQELLDEWNENLDAQSRFEAVMATPATSLFVVERLNSPESNAPKGHRTSVGKLIACYE